MLSRFTSLFSDLPLFLLRIPVVLLALTVHECAHARAAEKLVDGTARAFGRITLNPLKHLDPIGALMLLLCGFGWAKPVPINSRNFKKPRSGMALTALAGPLSNLLLGFLGCALYKVLLLIFTRCGFISGNMILTSSSFSASLIQYSVSFAVLFYSINISLAIFNLLPIPPLDGSRLLGLLLPAKWYYTVMRYERYIYMGMMLLLVFTDLFTVPLSFLVSTTIQGMLWLLERFPFFRF